MKSTGILKTVLALILLMSSFNIWSHPSTLNTPIMTQKRIHAFFSGKVQGVGFRATARQYAIKLGLLGWVKNLPDDRVEMVAEGYETHLTTLLSQLELKFTIVKSEIKTESPKEKLSGFKILH